MASVVLIQAREPVGSPLPVLSRGPVDPISHRDRGVVVQAGLVPPLPMLEVLAPHDGQPVARLDQIIDLQGHHLDGTGRDGLAQQRPLRDRPEPGGPGDRRARR